MLPNINPLLLYSVASFLFCINNVVGQSTTTVATSLYRGTYLIVAPKTIRPGLPYAVSVNVLQSAAPVTLTMKIVDSDNKSYVQKVQEGLKSGSPVTVKIDKVPNTLSSGVSYNLYVKGESSGRTLFEQTNYLYFNDKSFSTFIQTDKAIYKPGSTIHIRIVAVYPDLKPYKGVANIKITDPNRNVVQQFSNATIDKGVIGKKDSLSLSLVEEPPLGDWTISCDIDGTKTEKQFTVDKYVLPKFDVTVKPPPYLITTDDLTVTVTSKYTYGKGVEGSATLYIQRPYYFGDDRQRTITRTQDLDKNGDAIFKISNKALNEVQLMDPYGGSLKMTATVTEKLTGTQRNGTADVTIYRQKYKLTINKPSETYLPGLDYAVSVALTTQDDKPASISNGNKVVNITTTYTFPYSPPPPNTTNWISVRERIDNHLLSLNNDGTLTYVAKTAPGSNNMRLDVRYGPDSDPISTSLYVDASKSPSQSYLQVTTDKTSVKAGETVTFNINTTFDLPTLTAQVMTRGYMVFIKNVDVKNRAAQVQIPTTAEMAPKARLIVYGVRPDNKEIVVSAMDLKVDGLLQNKVSISVDPTRTEPGKNVTFTISASPTSYIGLLSVDQSVLLLKSGNDITKSQVESEIAQYDTTGYSGRWWGPFNRQKRMICWGCGWWGIGGKDAATIFENSGVIVMTDAYLYREPVPIILFRSLSANAQGMPGPPALMGPVAPEQQVQSKIGPPTVAVRTKFPETWIWTDLQSKDGKTTYTVEVPDTITSWITSAFAMHDVDGLGVVDEPAKLEVFRPFFIRLNLPYSVKRGEKLALQVLLSNYMDADQMTTVTLDHNGNSPFDLIPKPGDKKDKQTSQKDNMRIVNVPAGGSTSVFFPIIPTKVGDLKLLVKAIGGKSSDAVENVLIVEAEGYPIYKNKPFIIDLTSNNTWKNKIQMDFPANAIPGSQKASVTFVGDIMGPILDNIEKLIQMPYGCGEQNMLNFVPNIVVTRYLTATNRLTPALQEKTKKYMESGAQRELTYQRDDASYSAFGKSDKAGSTWLTAFVVRSFHMAKPYIYIDDDKLAKSLTFLKSQQKENGAFAENGEVHHKAMQGGAAAGGAALTAYVFLALVENNVSNAEAQKFLERSLELIGDDTYALAVITYALHLSQSSRKDDAFKMLEGKAVNKDGLKYWKKAESKVDDIKAPYWYDKPPPAEVEMTSYALLTYLLRGDVSGALPLVRWLVGQQNAQGGFSSTQDTVVGLEALGAYAAKSYSPNVGAKLTARNGDQKHTFDVTAANAIVQQQLDLKNYDQPVELDAQGKGVSFGQVNWHYNLPQLSDDQPFSCDEQVQQNSANEVLVNLCCKYALPGRSNMALMEVESPSGFMVDQEKLNQLTKIKNLQRVETDQGETKANIYFNSIGNDAICLNVTSQRVFSVADQKSSVVKLSDYYAPEIQIRFDYTIAKKLTIDEVCGGDCWRDDSGKAAATGSPSASSHAPKVKAAKKPKRS